MISQAGAVLRYRPDVSGRMETFLASQLKSASGGPAWKADVIRRLNRFVRGGKLLRSSLVCYSYRLFEQEQSDSLPGAILDVAIATELLHAALLIHDDIIDDDDVRRGQPAIHRQYSDLMQKRPAAADHFGTSMALCAGDMVLSMSFGLLAGADSIRPGTVGKLNNLFADTLVTTAAGQMQDINLGALANRPDKRQIYEVMRAKTAMYSVALPLIAGAITAGQPSALYRQLQGLGLIIGTIFQIRDDELGVYAKTETTGKPVGSDIREGKKTLLHYYVWRAASPQEQERLSNAFGNPDASASDIAAVRKIMTRHQVRKHLQLDVDTLERRARQHIDRIAMDRAAKQELCRLVAYCSRRKA